MDLLRQQGTYSDLVYSIIPNFNSGEMVEEAKMAGDVIPAVENGIVTQSLSNPLPLQIPLPCLLLNLVQSTLPETLTLITSQSSRPILV